MRFHLLLAALSLSACASAPRRSAPAQVRLAPGTARLIVRIDGVHGARGHVLSSLFDRAAGFPGASPIVGGQVTLTAQVRPLEAVYEHLPAGDYAVSVLHDENDSGALDTNLFGAPTEGYGASRNALPPASAPTFGDARVALADGESVTLDVHLRY